MRHAAGIDLGTALTKAVIVGGGDGKTPRVLGRGMVKTGVHLEKAAAAALVAARDMAQLAARETAYVVATGFGRYSPGFRDTQVTEITSAARGAWFLFPESSTVLDIGSQSTRALSLTANGRVHAFKTNDKCAAGSGSFIVRAAKYLQVDMEKVGELALAAGNPQPISSICAVLAESEIINHVSAGVTVEDILGGIYDSLASRAGLLLKRVNMGRQLTFIGGVARQAAWSRRWSSGCRSRSMFPRTANMCAPWALPCSASAGWRRPPASPPEPPPKNNFIRRGSARISARWLLLSSRLRRTILRSPDPIMKRFLLLTSLLFLALAAAAQSRPAAKTFDIVILHGRVMDPESGLDAPRNLGISGKRIAAITTDPIHGKKIIDARGLVVAPGFIDLHSHGQDAENYRYKAMDGVTTALELEIGVADIDQWYAQRQGKALINFGATIGHVPTRMRLMHDSGTFLPHDAAATTLATPEQIAEMRRDLEHGLARGALGVGFGIGYVPAATRWEIIQMFTTAATYHAPAFVHLRGGNAPDSPMAALEEAIAAAEITGAPLHVVHISSTGLRSTPQMLASIAGARRHGLDVTTECYPYTAAMTDLGSALFGPGWQQGMGITYKDLQWVATGERLTPESFAKYRKQGGLVIIHSIPPDIARLAVSSPLTMIASDGLIENGKGHPRGAGTYARVLGYYVREQHALSLMDALRKMSLMPAQRLEDRAPMMKNKGRVKVGADADLTIFDPQRVIDRATYERIAYSEGMEYVLVGGVPVVSGGKLVEGVDPGEAIRAPVQKAGGGSQ